MLLLLRTAFQQGHRYMLLGVTVFFMLVVTLASQAEMLTLGVVTNAGCDAFELFAPEKDGKIYKTHRLHRDQLDARWNEIDTEGTGVISKADATRFLVDKKERNLFNEVFSWASDKTDWRNNLFLLITFMVTIAVVKGICLFWSSYLQELVLVRVSRDLRHRYFKHIQGLPLTFYNKHNIGALSTRVCTDAEQIAKGVSAGLTAFLQTPFTIVSSFFLCLYISVKLTFVVFLSFPIVIFPFLYLSRRVKKASRQALTNTDKLTSILIECLSGIQTIKLFAVEAFSLGKFRNSNNEKARLESKGARYGYMARPVMHTASVLILGGILLYGSFGLKMSIGEILVFCGLTYLMYEPIKKISDQILFVQKGVAAAERMSEVMALQPHSEEDRNTTPLSFSHSLEFKDVWFKYENEWVLKGVSFTVNRGEVVALVGSTGAGKSTIVHLLPRLYEAQKGEILIDGQPLASYTQQSLREQLGFVPQKPFFFYDTVVNNIAFGGNYTREEVIDAAKRAHAHEFIERLPNGYDTILAEAGKDLSGGQQQRLAIARALVRKTPILVLDEATSSLDAVSEDKIKGAISDLRGQATQLIIAHRLSTVEDADKILFLEHGEVTAQGTRDELLESCPQFKAMWDLMKVGATV